MVWSNATDTLFQQSLGWEHYEVHEPEPHILLFKYPFPRTPCQRGCRQPTDAIATGVRSITSHPINSNNSSSNDNSSKRFEVEIV